MQPSANIHYDVASAISLGQRDHQEDAVITDFPVGAGFGFAVLADGMGGHAAGDIASKIVVTEVFSELKLQSGDPRLLEDNMRDVLHAAAATANECVRSHASLYPETAGMGATLVAPVLVGDHLYWISIGDSPLLLFRDGELVQLNEDHSMAPQIDFLVRAGLMATETGQDHPDRSCLTSVLVGQQIPRIDCPDTPFALRDGDILIVASDGLQFLGNDEIADLLGRQSDRASAEISASLLRCLEELADPEQDNISFSVIKFENKSAANLDAACPVVDINEPARSSRPFGKRNTLTVCGSVSETGVSMLCHLSRSSEKSA